MTSVRNSLVVASLLVCSSSFACAQYNPAFDPSALGGETAAEVGSEGVDTSEASEATDAEQGTDTGTGTGDTGTDTDTDTDTGPNLCGNGALEPDEQCDDGNAINDDGCLANCRIPATCAEILAFDPQAPSGDYLVDPGATGEPWPAACDMDLDGGGWTGFVVQDTCNGHLVSALQPIWPAQLQGIDDSCRVYAEYEYGGALGYTWDIVFPPGFEAFFLRDYQVKGIGTPEFGYPQELWSVPAVFPDGALSFGDAQEDGPIANWALDGGTIATFLEDEIKPYPAQDQPFVLGQASETLRIGFGERGTMQREGLYPWWSGRIFVR